MKETRILDYIRVYPYDLQIRMEDEEEQNREVINNKGMKAKTRWIQTQTVVSRGL